MEKCADSLNPRTLYVHVSSGPSFQNAEAQGSPKAHDQLDASRDQGISFQLQLS